MTRRDVLREHYYSGDMWVEVDEHPNVYDMTQIVLVWDAYSGGEVRIVFDAEEARSLAAALIAAADESDAH